MDSTFEDSEFLNDMHGLKIGPQIGKGEFSTVYGTVKFVCFANIDFYISSLIFCPVGRYFGELVAVKKQIRQSVVSILNHSCKFEAAS